MRISRTGILSSDRQGSLPFMVKKGFTLLEVVVVLFIIGMMALLIYPNIQSFTDDGLSIASRRLTGTIQFLFHESMASRKVHRLSYDLQARQARVRVLGQDGLLSPPAARVKSEVVLPRGVSFRDITTLRLGKVSEGKVYTHFFPSGLAEKTVIHLVDEEGDALTLEIHPLTGRVTIYEGYVEVEDPLGGMRSPLAQTVF